jgi:hypothetical protein
MFFKTFKPLLRRNFVYRIASLEAVIRTIFLNAKDLRSLKHFFHDFVIGTFLRKIVKDDLEHKTGLLAL